MFKYNIGQTIWYIKDNRFHSAPVLSRVCVENKYNNLTRVEQNTVFNRFGHSKVKYATCHGEFTENNSFASKEELINFLAGDN